MDEVVNRFARELAEAIATAVAHDPRVETCRARARAAGFEMRVSLEATVGFVSRGTAAATARVLVPAVPAAARGALEMSASDRRFLRSLRIAAHETTEEV